MKFRIFVLFLIIVFCIALNAFEIEIDSVYQRNDGSKFIDIWFSVYVIDTLCINSELTPITLSGEPLSCWSFVMPSDTGEICANGHYHIVWNFGADVPNREFYEDKIEFSLVASTEGIDPYLCCPDSVVDIDGNVYDVIQIGGRCWMAENLKATHYRDSTEMPNVTNRYSWLFATSGGYCNFNHDPSNVDTYGRLYNWHAVNDSRGLAPEGWHIPTDYEFKLLEHALGMRPTEIESRGYRGTNQGSQLATRADLWRDDTLETTDGFDMSGFRALPAGYCRNDGHFFHLGENAFFWTSTLDSTSYGFYRTIIYNHSNIYRSYYLRQGGMSVRCVKD